MTHADWLDEVFRVAPTERDRLWIERELGDVPQRIVLGDGRVAEWNVSVSDWDVRAVPVESLGRES